jgi:murein DD-endopeptidase MepM/ murein hydrolase activator NlpD
MTPLPELLRIVPAAGPRHVVLRARPDVAAPDVGETSAGQHVAPTGISRDALWYAVSWDGGTAWLSVADTVPAGRGVASAIPNAGLPFDWPVGPADQRSAAELPRAWYIAVGFAEEYQPSSGQRAVHTGLDLNLRSGGDTDLGAPVYAAADGVVTASGSWPVWGNIVLVRHDLPDGQHLWSQYAHLARRLVTIGRLVKRGDQLGTIGKGQGNRFAAHLHFEIRRRSVPAQAWPGLNRSRVTTDYVDPHEVIGAAHLSSDLADTYPLLGLAGRRNDAELNSLARAGGGWVVLRTAVGIDAASAPLDLTRYIERGLRVVMHFVPVASDTATTPAVDAAFAERAALSIERTIGEPWAVLLGGDWDGPEGDPPEWQPRDAAERFNHARSLVKAALVATGRPGVRVGPGPLARPSAPRDPLGFWTAMLSAVDDLDVLAVRAWSYGQAPELARAPLYLEPPTATVETFNAYRSLLAAVPAPFRSRPAFLYPVDATEPWCAGASDWLNAVQDNVTAWNAAPGGPAVRGVVLGQGFRQDEAVAPPPGLWPTRRDAKPLSDAVHDATRSAPSHPIEVPWRGSGLLLDDWGPASGEGGAIRSARAAGVQFVVIKAAAGERALLNGPGLDGAARTATAWRNAGALVWGWGNLTGQTPELEAAVAAARVRALGAHGWILEPNALCPPGAATAFVRVLRQALGGMPLGMLIHPRLPADVRAAFAPHVDVLLPVVPRTGMLGSAAAELVRYGRPVVPVLRTDEPPDVGELTEFLAAAAASRREGAALWLAVDTAEAVWRSATGDVGGLAWPVDGAMADTPS